jgi:hypothetical protein
MGNLPWDKLLSSATGVVSVIVALFLLRDKIRIDERAQAGLVTWWYEVNPDDSSDVTLRISNGSANTAYSPQLLVFHAAQSDAEKDINAVRLRPEEVDPHLQPVWGRRDKRDFVMRMVPLAQLIPPTSTREFHIQVEGISTTELLRGRSGADSNHLFSAEPLRRVERLLFFSRLGRVLMNFLIPQIEWGAEPLRGLSVMFCDSNGWWWERRRTGELERLFRSGTAVTTGRFVKSTLRYGRTLPSKTRTEPEQSSSSNETRAQ